MTTNSPDTKQQHGNLVTQKTILLLLTDLKVPWKTKTFINLLVVALGSVTLMALRVYLMKDSIAESL